jgi:hypothetical protein
MSTNLTNGRPVLTVPDSRPSYVTFMQQSAQISGTEYQRVKNLHCQEDTSV